MTMMAVGCIQAQRCQINGCPVGNDLGPERARALVVPERRDRVERANVSPCNKPWNCWPRWAWPGLPTSARST